MDTCSLFYNPRCSKCREAKGILEYEKIPVHLVEYLTKSPSEKDLLELMKILVEDISTIVRVKEAKYQELKFSLTDAKAIAKNLAKYPELIERPIFIWKNKAIVARPVEKMKKIMG